MLWRLNGSSIHDLTLLPLEKVKDFFDKLQLPAPLDEAIPHTVVSRSNAGTGQNCQSLRLAVNRV